MEKYSDSISSEVLAAYMAGNATADESKMILEAISDDAELREVMRISAMVDADLRGFSCQDDDFPMMRMAANCEDGAYCSMECEMNILSRRGIRYDEAELLAEAVKNGWQKEDGTALHNIGRHLERFGLRVTRKFDCTQEDIIAALDAGEDLIAAVDGGELLGDLISEAVEDQLLGEIPDHAVVILSYDKSENTIKIFDPDSANAEDTYPWNQFANAWKDSRGYLVRVGEGN